MSRVYYDFTGLDELYGMTGPSESGWVDLGSSDCPSWNLNIPCDWKDKISDGNKKAFSNMSKEDLSKKAIKGVETKRKEMDWVVYSSLPVWKDQVIKKGTKILIESIDKSERLIYNSIKEAERDGWNKKIIITKLQNGKDYRRRSDGKQFRIIKL